MKCKLSALFALFFFARISFAADTRLPIPSAQQQADLHQIIRQRCGDLYTDPKDSQQVDLSQMLLSQALTCAQPDEKFVLLCESRDAAARGGSLELGDQTCQDLANQYQISFNEAQVGFFQAGASRLVGRTQRNNFLTSVLQAYDDAINAGQFDPAGKLLDVADSVAGDGDNASWTKVLSARRADYGPMKSAYAVAGKALDAVRQGSSDPQMNAIAGDYYCFGKGDWQTGLPLLARGNDIAAAKAASIELQDPADADAKLVIADSWFNYAKSMTGNTTQIELHSYDWYLRALPHLSDADQRDHAKQRIAQFATILAGRIDLPLSWAAVGDALASQSFRPSPIQGGAIGSNQFSEIPPDGAILIGFRVGVIPGSNGPVVGFIQPIYNTPHGELLGQGVGNRPDTLSIAKAPEGYAVSGIKVRGTGELDSLWVYYMKINGGLLDPKTELVAGPIGNAAPGDAPKIDGHGIPAIGITGRADNQQGNLALGLIFASSTASADGQ